MKDSAKTFKINDCSILLNERKIAKYLATIILALLFFNVVNIAVQNYMPLDALQARFIDRFFNFNGENNFPSFFSTLLLLFASVLLFFVYTHVKEESRTRKEWMVLGVVFAFLTLDENIQIHETISKFTRPLISDDFSGLLYWSWVLPYFLFSIAIALYLLKFVLALPHITRNLFFLSAFLFISGALGLELIEGYVYKSYGLNHLYNQILYCVEELMEMAGVTIFIYSLLQYINAFAAEIEQTAELKLIEEVPESEYIDSKPV